MIEEDGLLMSVPSGGRRLRQCEVLDDRGPRQSLDDKGMEGVRGGLRVLADLSVVPA